MTIEIDMIPKKSTISIEIAVQVCTKGELFDRLLWQADLYLRDKLIEYNFEKIRVSPFYVPQEPPADILMITHSGINRKAFIFWQMLFQNLNVTVDFWDTDRHNGLSVDKATQQRHGITWVGRYTGKLIVYPLCNLQLLQPFDMACHFTGLDLLEETYKDLDSGMILYLPKQGQGENDLPVLRHIAVFRRKTLRTRWFNLAEGMSEAHGG